jgi:hypothetical protein
MDVWLYEGAKGLYALARDEDGANLPLDLGPWTKRQSVTLSHDPFDEREAITLIETHGYCCFD